MQVTELFYPEAEAAIGPYIFKSGIEIHVSLSKSSCFGRIRFVRQLGQRLEISPGTPASIRMGYSGSLTEVLRGYVSRSLGQSGRADELLIRDGMMLLEMTKVSAVFMDAAPQDIVRYCLNQAGVTEARISDKHYPAKKRVAIYQKSAAAAIAEIGVLWDISEPFFFSGGVFYWGCKPEQDKSYSFEYGGNIIALTRMGGVWEIETVSVPFIRHAQRIHVTHPLVTGEFELQKIVFSTNEAGFIRTTITF